MEKQRFKGGWEAIYFPKVCKNHLPDKSLHTFTAACPLSLPNCVHDCVSYDRALRVLTHSTSQIQAGLEGCDAWIQPPEWDQETQRFGSPGISSLLGWGPVAAWLYGAGMAEDTLCVPQCTSSATWNKILWAAYPYTMLFLCNGEEMHLPFCGMSDAKCIYLCWA